MALQRTLSLLLTSLVCSTAIEVQSSRANRRKNRSLRKQQLDEEAKAEEAQEVQQKMPGRIPVLLEKDPSSSLPTLSENQMIVPSSMTAVEFKQELNNIFRQTGKSNPVDLVVGTKPQTEDYAWTLGDLFIENKGADGFLHIGYTDAAERGLY